jgi:hypothetical protein
MRKSICAWGTVIIACPWPTLDKMSSSLILISRVNVTVILLLVPIDDIVHAWFTIAATRICLVCFRWRYYTQISIPNVGFRWFGRGSVRVASSGSEVSSDLVICLTQDISILISCHYLAFKEFLAFILELSYPISITFGRLLNVWWALHYIWWILVRIDISLALNRLPSNPHFESNWGALPYLNITELLKSLVYNNFFNLVTLN